MPCGSRSVALGLRPAGITCHWFAVQSVTATRCSTPSSSNKQSSTRLAFSENSEKFVPSPSQSAPWGKGLPGLASIWLIGSQRSDARLHGLGSLLADRRHAPHDRGTREVAGVPRLSRCSRLVNGHILCATSKLLGVGLTLWISRVARGGRCPSKRQSLSRPDSHAGCRRNCQHRQPGRLSQPCSRAAVLIPARNDLEPLQRSVEF